MRILAALWLIVVLLLSFSVSAQDVPTGEPSPTATEIVPLDPSPTPPPDTLTPDPVTPAPTTPPDITALPTQDVTPVSTQDVTAAPTQDVTAVSTQEMRALPTQDVTPAPTQSMTPDVTAMPLAYRANFDADWPADLSANTGWLSVNVVTGKALQTGTGAAPITYQAATFTDAAVEASFLLNAGQGIVMLRGYSAALAADGTLTLAYNDMAQAVQVVPLSAGAWATLRLELIGTGLQVRVNQAVVMDTMDAYGAGAGPAGFAASATAVLRVDDFAIYGVPAAALAVIPATTLPSGEKPSQSSLPLPLPQGPISCSPAGQIAMASVNGTTQGNAIDLGSRRTLDNASLHVSDEGRYVFFISYSTNLVAANADTNSAADLFRFDRVDCSTIRVNVNDDETQMSSGPAFFTVSNDGNLAAFSGLSGDIFVRNISAGTTTTLSPSGGFAPAISGDGLYIAFLSSANLVAADTNNSTDVYRLSLAAPTTYTLVSVSSSGTNEPSSSVLALLNHPPAISDDGSSIVWGSTGQYGFTLNDTTCDTDLNGTFTEKCVNLFWRNINAGTTQIVTVTNAGATGTRGIPPLYTWFSLSGNGRTVAFTTESVLDAALDQDTVLDVYVRDTQTSTTTLASVNHLGQNTTAPAFAYDHALSDDGSRLAFSGANYTSIATPNAGQLYVRDLVTAQNVLASVNVSGAIGSGSLDAMPPSGGLSGNGLFVVFISSHSNFVLNDNVNDCDLDGGTITNDQNCSDVFIAPVPLLFTPSNVSAAASGVNVNVTWTDTNSTETRYEIQRYINQNTSATVGFVNANGTLFTESNLGCGLTVWYRVRAYRTLDNTISPWSNWASVSTADCTAQPCPATGVQRVNVGSSGTRQSSETRPALGRDMSYDGRYVVFAAPNPLTGVPADEIAAESEIGANDTYLYDTLTCTTTKISVADESQAPNLESQQGAYAGGIVNTVPISGVFYSASSHLPATTSISDTDGVNDVFMGSGSSTRMVSLQNGGTASLNGDMTAVTATLDGRYILMKTADAVPGVTDNNGTDDLVLYDTQANVLFVVTLNTAGETANAGSFGGSIVIGSNGHVYVVFHSRADDFVSGDTNTMLDVFVRDVTGSFTARLSLADNESQLAANSWVTSITARNNLLYVIFQVEASETGSVGGPSRVLLRTVSLEGLESGTTQLISRAAGAAGTAANSASYDGQISVNARWVAFTSAATNLVTGDTNGAADVFVRDLVTNQVQRVSRTKAGAQLAQMSSVEDISGDGTKILFRSAATTLVANDSNNTCETDFLQFDYNENCADLFVIANPLYALPAAPAPFTATTTLPTSINLAWANVIGEDEYKIERTTDNGVTWQDVDWRPANTTSYTISGLSCGQTFVMRMYSAITFPALWLSAPSATVTGRTVACAVPTLSLPAAGFISSDTTPDLSWLPLPNITDYEIQVSTSATFATLLAVYPQTVNGRTHTLITALADGVYYWRVKAIAPGTSGFSLVRSFTIDTTAPAVPLLTTPAHLATVRTPRPVFTWAAVAGATRYNVQIDYFNDFVSPDYDITTSALTFTPPADLPQAMYYARIKAVDAAMPNNNISAFSTIVTFTVNPALTPAPDAVVATTGTATSANVTFTWTKGLAPLAAPAYTVEMYELVAGNFGTLRTCTAALVTTPTCTIPNVAQGTYAWRVLRNGESAFPVDFVFNTFYVSPAAPRAPRQTAPLNNLFIPASDLGDNLFSLAWDWGAPPLTTPTGGPFTYDIEVSSSSTFATDALFTTTAAASPYPLDVSNLTTFPDASYFWRVRAVNALGVKGAWSGAFGFTLDRAAPTSAPNVTSVRNTMTGRPTVNWLALTGVWGYEISLLPMAQSCGGAALYTSSTHIPGVSYALPASVSALPQGNYRACVRAYDMSRNFGPYGARIFEVSLALTAGNGAFIPTIPVTTRPTLTWGAAPGIAGETVRYKLQIDTDTDFSGLHYESPLLTTTTYAVPVSQPMPADTYYWRVIRTTDNGTTFDTPPQTTFFYMGALGAGPLLTSPTMTPVQTFNTDVTLTWNSTTAPAGVSLTKYQIQVSTSPTFLSTLLYTDVSASGPLEYVFTLPANRNNVLYYWRVRGADEDTPITNWSAVSTFRVDNVSPDMPVVTAPVQSVGGTDVLYNTLRPTFTWAAVPGATRYRIRIIHIGTFLYHDLDPITAGSQFEVFVTGLSYTPPVNLRQGTLRLQMRAEDAINQSAETQYTVLLGLGTSPAHRGIVTTNRPVFTWPAVLGAASYTLEVDNDADFSSLLFTKSLTVPTYTPVAESLPANGAYYWRVTPVGSANANTPPVPHTFVFSATTKPLNLVQYNNTLGMDAIINPQEDNPLYFDWDALTVPGVQGYEIQFSRTAAFSVIVNVQTVASDQYTVFGDNPFAEGVWYWRVRGSFGSEAYGVWSDVKTFVMDTILPDAPTTTLLNGQTFTTGRPTFTWNAVPTAVRYRITVRDGVGAPVTGLNDVLAYGPTYTVPASITLLQNTLDGDTLEVIAEDMAGNYSPPLTRRFYVNHALLPLNAQTTFDSTPTFTWTALTGSGLGTWTVQIASDASMSSLVRTSLPLPAATGTYTVPNASPLPPGLYYWRVLRSVDDPANLDSRSLLVAASLANVTPTLISLPNADLVNAAKLATGELTWSLPAQVSAMAFNGRYRLEVATTATFTPATTVTTLVTATSHPLSALTLTDGVYYWRVRALFGPTVPLEQVGPASAIRSFIVDTTAPDAPALTTPIANARLTTRTPVFMWSVPAGAAQYTFELATDSTFTSIVRTASVSTPTYVTPAALGLADGVYFWRVMARDAAGNVSTPTTGRRLVIAVP